MLDCGVSGQQFMVEGGIPAFCGCQLSGVESQWPPGTVFQLLESCPTYVSEALRASANVAPGVGCVRGTAATSSGFAAKKESAVSADHSSHLGFLRRRFKYAGGGRQKPVVKIYQTKKLLELLEISQWRELLDGLDMAGQRNDAVPIQYVTQEFD
jgi:hypothetical protein